MNKSGFTLLELVVSMLILSITVAGSFGLITTCYKKINEAKLELQAVNQAATILEQLKTYVRDDDVGNNAFTEGDHNSLTDIGLGIEPEIQNVSSKEWEYSVGTDGDNKIVTATVKWEE